MLILTIEGLWRSVVYADSTTDLGSGKTETGPSNYTIIAIILASALGLTVLIICLLLWRYGWPQQLQPVNQNGSLITKPSELRTEDSSRQRLSFQEGNQFGTSDQSANTVEAFDRSPDRTRTLLLEPIAPTATRV